MKTLFISLVLLTFMVLLGCKVQQNAETSKSKETLKKEGVALFSSTLNTTYFFPFKDNNTRGYSLEEFMKHEYDTGFVLLTLKEEWINDIVVNYSMTLNEGKIFERVAYGEVEFSPMKSPAYRKDTTYHFDFEFSGASKRFVYDTKYRKLLGFRGINKN